MLYSVSRLTFIATNQEPLSSTGKWHLAQNSQPPRHLLTKIIPKILLKMRDLTTYAVITFPFSVGISKLTYQIKADIARITLSIFLSLETNIAWPWYLWIVFMCFFNPPTSGSRCRNCSVRGRWRCGPPARRGRSRLIRLQYWWECNKCRNIYYVPRWSRNRGCVHLFPKFSLLTKMSENRDRSRDILNL